MGDFRFSVKKSGSLRNEIYKDIKNAIIQGKLKPGQRLREKELSEEMGVSRGPIREAILILEKQGLLVTKEHRETAVASVEQHEVENLLNPMRQLLESFAIKKVLPTLTSAHFDHLEEILQQLINSCEQNNLEHVVSKDLEFHEFLVSKTNEPYLISLWQGVSSRIVFHFVHNFKEHQKKNFEDLILEHRLLLDVLKTKDWEKIEPVLLDHIY